MIGNLNRPWTCAAALAGALLAGPAGAALTYYEIGNYGVQHTTAAGDIETWGFLARVGLDGPASETVEVQRPLFHPLALDPVASSPLESDYIYDSADDEGTYFDYGPLYARFAGGDYRFRGQSFDFFVYYLARDDAYHRQLTADGYSALQNFDASAGGAFLGLRPTTAPFWADLRELRVTVTEVDTGIAVHEQSISPSAQEFFLPGTGLRGGIGYRLDVAYDLYRAYFTGPVGSVGVEHYQRVRSYDFVPVPEPAGLLPMLMVAVVGRLRRSG